MDFQTFDIPGLLHVQPQKHGDDRGYFAEIFREDTFTGHAGPIKFVQENQSLSQKVGTVRGLHFQIDPHAQGKLVRCLAGAIFDVAVDLRHGSPSFGHWVSVELSAQACNQLWIPAGFAHGFCTLQPDSVVCYKVTSYYNRESDRGVRWDDPTIGVAWPAEVDVQTLSAKDQTQPSFDELPPHFSYGA